MESDGELRSIAEIDEEHFGIGDNRRKTTVFSSQIENASQWGYAGDKEFQVDMKAEMII